MNPRVLLATWLRNSYVSNFFISKCIDTTLTKEEQLSNWNNRPLRKSQLHYAAADAYVQFLIIEKIKAHFLGFVIRKIYELNFRSKWKESY